MQPIADSISIIITIHTILKLKHTDTKPRLMAEYFGNTVSVTR